MVIFGCPGACVSPVPALCFARSSGAWAASSLARNLTCSGRLAFSCRGFGLAPSGPGTDASRLSRDCDPGAYDRHSA